MYYEDIYGLYVSALSITSMVSISIYEEKTDIERFRFPELKAKSEPEILKGSFFPFLITKLMPTHGCSIFS